MRFKIDENLPVELAVDLRKAGHEAETVIEENLEGAPDSVVLEAARRDRRILLTLDKGIASLVRYPATTHAGVVLFRPDSTGRRAILDFVRSRLSQLLLYELKDRVTVVTHNRIRSR